VPATLDRPGAHRRAPREVDTLDELERLAAAGALAGASDHSTTKSLYAKDPDGLELEVAWVVPADRLDDAALAGRASIRPLDIGREKQRYGGSTRGGVGISIPANACCLRHAVRGLPPQR